MSSSPPPLPHPRSPELPEGIERRPPEPEAGNLPEGTPPRDRLPAWPAWAPFAAMLLTVVLVVAGVTILTLVLSIAGVDVEGATDTPAITIGGTVLQDIALVVSAIVLARVVAGRPTPWQFGLRRTRVWPAIGWALAVMAGFYVLSFVYSVAFDVDAQDDLPEELGADESTVALAAVAILVTILAPIAEEFFFRGFFFTALRRSISTVPAAVVTGLVFGAIHLGSTDAELIVPLVFFGVGLCLLYHFTGSLLPCMVLHAVNNSVALGVTQGWTWYATIGMMAAAIAVILLLVLPLTRSRRLNLAPATA
jgi:membrane protease YdiL (CAAX protease family)